MNSVPLSGVAVTFRPDEGRPAVGETNTVGYYRQSYIRDTPGCKIGHHRVKIGSAEPSGEENEQDDFVFYEDHDASTAKVSASYKRFSPLFRDKAECSADFDDPPWECPRLMHFPAFSQVSGNSVPPGTGNPAQVLDHFT